MHSIRSFLIIALGIACAGCAAHVNLEPTGSGKLAANVGVGGPVIEAFDTNIPAPYLTVGGDYGATERLDVNANLHVLAFAYKVAGLDAGVTWFPVLRDGYTPTVGVQARCLLLGSLKTDVEERLRAYPVVSVTAAWGKASDLFYIGGDMLTRFSSLRYDDDTPGSIFSPFIGYRWEIGEGLYLFTEIKWQGANIRSDRLAVEYLPVGQYGALSTLFSIQQRF